MCFGSRIHEEIIERAPREQTTFWRLVERYEQCVAQHPNDYELWFNFVSHIKECGDHELVRRTLEQATANTPLTSDKGSWRPFIDLWILYAYYEEHNAQDIARARQVYKACLDLIPHTTFTFSKMWLLYAWFERRNNDITAARVALNQALDMCPRAKLYLGFIEMEYGEDEIETCRALYRELLELHPDNSDTWLAFAEMEIALGDIDRARDIFDRAVNESVLDDLETLQEAYDYFVNEHCPTDSLNASR